MVGKIYRVVFTRYAQNRRREVYHFEERINGKRYAKKIQQLISEATGKLESFLKYTLSTSTTIVLRRSGIPKHLNTRYYIIYESKRMKSSY
jgi:hypothetical protein